MMLLQINIVLANARAAFDAGKLQIQQNERDISDQTCTYRRDGYVCAVGASFPIEGVDVALDQLLVDHNTSSVDVLDPDVVQFEDFEAINFLQGIHDHCVSVMGREEREKRFMFALDTIEENLKEGRPYYVGLPTAAHFAMEPTLDFEKWKSWVVGSGGGI